MAPSWPKRFWNAIKPPPPVYRPGEEKPTTSRNRRLIALVAAVVVLLAVATPIVYSYIKAAPQRAEVKFQEAMRLMKPASYADAITRFDRAIAINPEMAQAYLDRGFAKRYLKQTDAALVDFNRALELNPNLSRAYTARGYIYRERGDVQRALAEFTRSIQIESNVEAHYERGQTYESLGDHQKAIADFDEAIALMRDAPYIYRARAMVKFKLGDNAGFQEDHATARKFEHY